MEKKITISIITAIKNDKDGLEKTLKSISKQSYLNYIEHLIIDGDSKDGTIEIIKIYEKQIFKWMSEPDKGLYFAMNKGLDMATGDFALFMNAGDEFYSNNVIENIITNIYDLNMIYFGNTYIFNGNFSFISEPINKKVEKNTSQYLPHHQSIFYPKSFYKSEKYDTNFSVCADADYTYRACNSIKIKYIDYNIIKSYLNGFGISQYGKISGLKKMIKERFSLDKKWGNNTKKTFFFKTYLSHILKYIFIISFGNKGAILLMRLNREIAKIFNTSLYR